MKINVAAGALNCSLLASPFPCAQREAHEQSFGESSETCVFYVTMKTVAPGCGNTAEVFVKRQEDPSSATAFAGQPVVANEVSTATKSLCLPKATSFSHVMNLALPSTMPEERYQTAREPDAGTARHTGCAMRPARVASPQWTPGCCTCKLVNQ
eukprot:5848750-Amphidinium_carterae.1